MGQERALGLRGIPLRAKDGTLRGVAVVDADDFDRLNVYRWYMGSGGYAVRVQTIGLHREVMGLGPGDDGVVDHRDHDPLNNCGSNLRVVTHQQNHQNRKSDRGSASRFRGVYRPNRVKGRPWQAGATVHGKFHHLGYFATEQEAADAAAKFRAGQMPYATD